MTHCKSPWCWERLRAEGEEGIRRWDGWRASLMQWTWTWTNSGRWWGTGRPGVLQSMGFQCIGRDWVTELNWSTGRLRSSSLWTSVVHAEIWASHAPVDNFPKLGWIAKGGKLVFSMSCWSITKGVIWNYLITLILTCYFLWTKVQILWSFIFLGRFCLVQVKMGLSCRKITLKFMF